MEHDIDGLAATAKNGNESIADWLEVRLSREREAINQAMTLHFAVSQKAILDELTKTFPYATQQPGTAKQPARVQNWLEVENRPALSEKAKTNGAEETSQSEVQVIVDEEDLSKERVLAVGVTQPSSKYFSVPFFATTIPSLMTHLKTEPRDSRLLRFVKSGLFEFVSGAAICSSFFIMAIHMEYQGFKYGHELGYRGFEKPPHQMWPGGDRVFPAFDWFFDLWFTIELILRLAAFRYAALRHLTIWIDATVVVTTWIQVISTRFCDPKMLRLFRLGKMLRLVKAAKSMRFFAPLFLLLESIYASMVAIIWSATFLLVYLTASGMVFNEFLSFRIDDPVLTEEQRLKLFKYFGTFENTIVSMYEVTWSNWVPVMRFLYEEVDEFFGLCLIFYRCVLCTALLATVMSLFIAETNRISKANDQVAAVLKRQSSSAQQEKIKRIFAQEGILETISMEELKNCLRIKEVRRSIKKNRWDTSDLIFLHRELSRRCGTDNVLLDQFVTGLQHLQGEALSVDLFRVQLDIQKMIEWSTTVNRTLQDICKTDKVEEQELEEDLKLLEETNRTAQDNHRVSAVMAVTTHSDLTQSNSDMLRVVEHSI